MKALQLFIAAGLFGYLLQAIGYILGMHAVARKKVSFLKFLLVSAISATVMFFVRRYGHFNFGVHTMLMLLIMNLLCVIVLKLDVMSSVLGSLIVTALIILGEVLNLGVLLLIYTKDVVDVRLAEPIFKAWAAVPGNVLLITVVFVTYFLRVIRKRKA